MERTSSTLDEMESKGIHKDKESDIDEKEVL